MIDKRRTDPPQTQPENSIDFDDFSGGYDALLRESTKQYTNDIEYFARYKVAIMQKRVQHPVRRVLEYGCGIGRNISHIAKAFPESEIVGTDISATSLEIAANLNPNVHFEVEHQNLDIGTFDLIFVASVFHHIPLEQRFNAMSSLSKRLNPNGNIFIFEHNPYHPVTRRIVSTCPFDADAILLKPSELTTLFSNTNINLIKKSFCLFIPPKLHLLNPIEKMITWLPLGGQYWVQGSK